MSVTERENLTRRYTVEIMLVIGPDHDIPAPDLGTDEQTMAWMMDTYSMTQGKTVPGIVTGKPLIVGGSAGRREATGRGIVYALYQAARHLSQPLRGQRVVVQGFGNVGSVAARLLWREGCVISGVGDVKGGIVNPHGIDIRQLEAHVAERSEERRVGKECRFRWSSDHSKKKREMSGRFAVMDKINVETTMSI